MDILKEYDTFIFDFDGTVADTLPIAFESFKQVFLKFNQQVLTSKEIESWFGPSEVGIIQEHLHNKSDSNEAIAMYYDIYEKKHEEFVRPNQEIIAMLNKLLDAKKQLAIVTGKGRKSYTFSTDKLVLDKYFPYSITSDDVLLPKPNQEGIEKVLRHYQAEKKRTIFFGDSNADILAAENAGIASIGVNWFYSNDITVTPTYISDSPLDIFC